MLLHPILVRSHRSHLLLISTVAARLAQRVGEQTAALGQRLHAVEEPL